MMYNICIYDIEVIFLALDGVFTRFLSNELNTNLVGARVSQIHQPNKDELVLNIRTFSHSVKLLISTRANSPRVSLTETSPENPASPPMFCMLLRKRLGGAKICSIRQPGLERIIFIDFDASNELGDIVRLTLACEIMGRYSNVIFIDHNGTVIDSLKRVDPSMSSQRIVLPGVAYSLPPAQDKLSLLDTQSSDVTKAIIARGDKLDKAILSVVMGISPIISRELAYRICGSGETVYSDQLSSNYRNRLEYYISKLSGIIFDNIGSPYCIYDENGKPKDMSFMDITQYGTFYSVKKFESFSALLDSFYSERDKAERIKAKSQDLLRLLTNAFERTARKINSQQTELDACADREHLRICGDLLQANLYKIEKGSAFVVLDNFYDENMGQLRITLDPSKSPSQNAQRYYKEYRKAKTAEHVLKEQIELAKAELQYLDNVFDALSRAETEAELAEIRMELIQTGYLKQQKGNRKGKDPKPLPPLEFRTKDGMKVLVGRNNRQNDTLTLKTASKNDVWFHTQDIPGSHTVLVTEGKTPCEESIIEAAQIAAYHSRASSSSRVAVDYTLIKNVSKPQGARPGMVIFVKNKTVYVEPKCGE